MDNELDTDVKETSETEDKKAPRIPKKLVKKLVIVAGMIIGQFIVAYFLLTTLNVTNLLSSHEEVIPVKVDSSRIKAEEKVSTFLGEEEVVDDTEAGVFSIDDRFVPMNPATLYEVDVIIQHELINCIHHLEVTKIRNEIWLHDG